MRHDSKQLCKILVKSPYIIVKSSDFSLTPVKVLRCYRFSVECLGETFLFLCTPILPQTFLLSQHDRRSSIHLSSLLFVLMPLCKVTNMKHTIYSWNLLQLFTYTEAACYLL